MDDIRHTEDPSCTKTDGSLCSCRCCEDMAILECKISEMEDRLKSLKSEKNETHSLINKRLPPEILSEIFVNCLATSEDLEDCCNHEYPLDFSPLQLGNVCRHWRDIAWSTPSIWCQFSLFLHSDQLEGNAILLADLAGEWLNRSGSLPLSLYILMQSDDHIFYENRSNFNSQHPVVEILKQYSQRWQNLNLRMWAPCLLQMGTDITEIPILQTLKLWPMGQGNEILWEHAKMTPQIVVFHLHEFVPSIPATSILEFFGKIDWRKVNDISVDSLPWDSYIEILKLMPHLTRFTISSIWERYETPAYDQLLSHSKLKFFKIHGTIQHPSIYNFYEGFISSLDFPALKELWYDVGLNSRPSQISDCHFPGTFMERIQDLERLTIQLSDSLEGRRYFDLLKKLPSLNYLFVIDRDSFPGRYYSSSEVGVDNPSLLSHLSAWNPDDSTIPGLSDLFFQTFGYPLTQTSNSSSHRSPVPESLATELFLPALRTFGYQASAHEPPWKRILMILGPLSKINNRYRRPLDGIHIDYVRRGFEDERGKQQLWRARKAGVDVVLRNFIAGFDKGKK